MTLSGGKRKVNKSLKAWVAFVKKVQKEEKLSYKDAIHRAKQRKDKGEKWMSGGATSSEETFTEEFVDGVPVEEGVYGGRRRRRTARRSRRRGRGRARTARRGRSQAQALALSQY